MPVHGGEGILVNLQKTSDIGQDLTFLRVIEPLGVLDLLPSEFGDGHSVVDVILVIDRRIAGISAGINVVHLTQPGGFQISDGLTVIRLGEVAGDDTGSGFCECSQYIASQVEVLRHFLSVQGTGGGDQHGIIAVFFGPQLISGGGLRAVLEIQELLLVGG